MLLIRVRLPNRPGALGAVATALGSIGADINLVEIVEKRHGVEVDELILDLPRSQSVESLVSVCDSLDGVQVEWIRNYPRGGGIELDVDLFRRMAANSSRSAEILVSAAPLVFRAHWSLLVEVSGSPRVSFSTPGAPDLDVEGIGRFRPLDTTHRVHLEDGWLPGWVAHHAVVAPVPEERAVVVGRSGDPAFFGSELARLNHLLGVTHGTDTSTEAMSTVSASDMHRSPVAPPLYERVDGSGIT